MARLMRLAMVALTACMPPPRMLLFNALDAGRVAQAQSRPAITSPLWRAYRVDLAAVLAARCRWMPSDSDYWQAARPCYGKSWSAVLALGRFLHERDALTSPRPHFLMGGRLRAVEAAPLCYR